MLTKSNHRRSNLLVAGILLSLIVSFSSCSKDDSNNNHNGGNAVPSPSYDSGKDFNIKVVDCLGVENKELSQGDRQQFVPTYYYNTFKAELMDNVVRKGRYGTGATLLIEL